MKKSVLFSAAACLAMLLTFTGCSDKKKLNLSDGTFTGTGAGRNGPIQVLITVTDGELSAAKITKEEEAQDIGHAIEDELLASFLKNKGDVKKIDVISGATITSNGIKEALTSAINKSIGIEKSKEQYPDSETDIVIIGAGGAGLTAATEAASRGAKVIVLEKNGFAGGNTNSSTGGLNASETSVQKVLGIKDSTEQFYEDTMNGGHYKNDSALVRTMVEASAEIVDWLQGEQIGADLSDVGLMGGSANKRSHRPAGGKAIGSHLVPKLYEAAKKAGAEIRLSNTVTDILSENGEPSAVRVQNDSGSYIIKAKAIIIATGGFGANSQLIGKYRPELQNYPTTNIKSTQGDAFAWVEKFDAELVLMNEIQTHPTVVAGTGILITEAVRGNGAIMLDHKGRRFVNELARRDFTSQQVLSLPEKTAFIFFNEEVRKSLLSIEEYVDAGLLTEAETVEDIAEKLKMDPAVLRETLDTYNAAKAAGKDELFDRPDLPVSFEKGPYYAVEVEPAIHHTMGGLKINTKAQVLNKSGKIIPKLFAAGEVTGGVHGDNRLGGNAVAEICIFGRIAAKSACESIGY